MRAIESTGLSLAGPGGAVAGDMQLRNIRIADYLGVFLVVDAFLLTLFCERPCDQ